MFDAILKELEKFHEIQRLDAYVGAWKIKIWRSANEMHFEFTMMEAVRGEADGL